MNGAIRRVDDVLFVVDRSAGKVIRRMSESPGTRMLRAL
jgi:hypothetical protein